LTLEVYKNCHVSKALIGRVSCSYAIKKKDEIERVAKANR